MANRKRVLGDIRRSRGITQQELASRLGTVGPRVSDWERGVRLPDEKNLAGLAEVLRVSEGTVVDAILMARRKRSAE